MEDLVGKTLPVPEENIKAVKALLEAEEQAMHAARRFANEAHAHNKRLWELIHKKALPELAGYHLSINNKTMEVSVLGER